MRGRGEQEYSPITEMDYEDYLKTPATSDEVRRIEDALRAMTAALPLRRLLAGRMKTDFGTIWGRFWSLLCILGSQNGQFSATIAKINPEARKIGPRKRKSEKICPS